MDLALLLQASGDGGATAVGLFRFFAGFFIIIAFYTGRVTASQHLSTSARQLLIELPCSHPRTNLREGSIVLPAEHLPPLSPPEMLTG